MKRPALALALALAATSAALAAPSFDGARITNSGSTNAAGWSIALRSDGLGTVTMQTRDVAAAPTPRAISVDRDLAAHFFATAQLARRQHAPMERCMKSASFGTIVTVHYHGWRSIDLTCPPLSGAMGALALDVQKIQTAAGLSAVPPRRIPNPNYLKRAPLEGPAQPTPKATP